MKIKILQKAKEQAKELGVSKQFNKQLKFLEHDITYPSLRVKFLEPKEARIRSFRINDQYRGLFIKDGNTYIITNVGDYH